MQRDADATKQRLIAAGRGEFAAHGLTGARVDRIAAAAQSNKAQIYHYFKSKAGLFDAVWDDLCGQIIDGLPNEPHDLPGLAVMLSDAYAEHPELPRLITWQRLERGSDPPHELSMKDLARRIAAIREAQDEGVVPTHYDAGVLFGLMLHVAAFWEFSSPDVLRSMAVGDRDVRREIVRSVAAALLDGGHS
jgi:AcrR family transcriptional regulator